MFALGRAERAVLVALGTAALAGAFVTAPFVARGSAAHDDRTPDVLASAPRVVAARLAAPHPRRDPFVGDDVPTTTTSPSPVPAWARPPIPAALPVLPPNAAAAQAGANARIAAVVTGAHPFALVTDERGPHLIAPGDRLDGSVVAAIDGAGVTLADGTRLPLRAGFEGGSTP